MNFLIILVLHVSYGVPHRTRTYIPTFVVSYAIHYTNGTYAVKVLYHISDILFIPSSAIFVNQLLIGAVCGNRTRDPSLEGSYVTSTPIPHNKGVNAFTLYYHSLSLFYLDASYLSRR